VGGIYTEIRGSAGMNGLRSISYMQRRVVRGGKRSDIGSRTEGEC
jgi:hypothetical protein